MLPAGFPNLLVNGAGGIADRHGDRFAHPNLGEVIEQACVALIDRSALSVEDLIGIPIRAPISTTGIILGRQGIHAPPTVSAAAPQSCA